MINLQAYLESGILESYVLGELEPDAALEVAQFALEHAEVGEELQAIRETLLRVAEKAAISPSKALKGRVMAALDGLADAQNDIPPVLTAHSHLDDYGPWTSKISSQVPAFADNIHVIPCFQSRDMFMAMVWVKSHVPQEVHHRKIEKLLILEGSCEITMNGKTEVLGPGDFLSIPLHIVHHVQVTSDIPCRFLLQRIAA